jgi:hypothetical protein
MEAGMADEALASCVGTLSAVFIFGGDITPAQDREPLGGLGWRSLKGLERDKTGPMPSYERVLAGECLHRMNPRLLLIPSGGKSNLPTKRTRVAVAVQIQPKNEPDRNDGDGAKDARAATITAVKLPTPSDVLSISGAFDETRKPVLGIHGEDGRPTGAHLARVAAAGEPRASLELGRNRNTRAFWQYSW